MMSIFRAPGEPDLSPDIVVWFVCVDRKEHTSVLILIRRWNLYRFRVGLLEKLIE
jgi:hypothetical protein